jgi:hypothetical protein
LHIKKLLVSLSNKSIKSLIMKTFLLGVVLLFSTLSFAQETEFTLNQEGLTSFVITPVKGKTQEELYKKTIDWVQVTFKNPREVIKGQIQNDYIRIEGSSENLVSFCPMGCYNYLTRYQIEISLKDDKYKFEILNIEYFITPSQYGVGGWKALDLTNTFKIKSYMKNDEIRTLYKNLVRIPLYFNNLNKELQTFILTDSTTKKKDW